MRYNVLECLYEENPEQKKGFLPADALDLGLQIGG